MISMPLVTVIMQIYLGLCDVSLEWLPAIVSHSLPYILAGTFFIFFIRFWSGLRQIAWFNKDYLISTLHSLLQNTPLMSGLNEINVCFLLPTYPMF